MLNYIRHLFKIITKFQNHYSIKLNYNVVLYKIHMQVKNFVTTDTEYVLYTDIYIKMKHVLEIKNMYEDFRAAV